VLGPLKCKFPKHLSNGIYAHYEDLTLHTEVHWLRKQKLLFSFLEILLVIVVFLQNTCDVLLQLKDSWQLLDLPFLTNVTANYKSQILDCY